jgi:F420-non-reducing hydrogenase iron-sulfur subunit
VTRQSYATEIRIIRLMCTGRADLAFVFRALEKGADGVIIGGCWPGECHYVTEGNYDALGNMLLGKKLMERIGISPTRLRLEWISAAEGARFAEVMSDFANQLRELGPLGEGEGIEPDDLRMKLGTLSKLVPYVKLVEREKLRVTEKKEERYYEFYESDRVKVLFEELFADKLAVGQALHLLGEKPRTTRELAEKLGLTASEVGKHMSMSTRQGLVRYDRADNCYALA